MTDDRCMALIHAHTVSSHRRERIDTVCNLQDVPVAVTVFGREQLEEVNFHGLVLSTTSLPTPGNGLASFRPLDPVQPRRSSGHACC